MEVEQPQCRIWAKCLTKACDTIEIPNGTESNLPKEFSRPK